MNQKKYVDLDPSFTQNPITGDIGLRQDDRAIRSAVKNLVMTSVYEKPFHSEINSPIKNLLFENFGNNFEIVLREAVSNLISAHEPRVDVVDVAVKPSHDNNAVYINISFMIKNTLRRLTVDIILERTR